MKRSDWKYKLWLWWAIKVLRVPFTVNFTHPEDPNVYGIGFAWTEEQARNMRGDVALRHENAQLQQRIQALSGTRKGRRIMNSAAKKAVRIKK